MRRHLPAVTLTFALREVIERQFRRGNTATENERAIAIITADVVARLRLNGNGGERLMAHAGNVKVALALAVEILLAQIAMPALEQDRKESEFLLLGQRHRQGMAVEVFLERRDRSSPGLDFQPRKRPRQPRSAQSAVALAAILLAESVSSPTW